jgi:hypothetical protein
MSLDHPFAEALQATFDLHDFGVKLMRYNIERAHPTADAREIDDRLGAWLHERPGAEAGDCGSSDNREQ